MRRPRINKVLGCSTVNLPAVADPVDAHNADLIANFVNHAIVTNTYSPVLFAPRELAAT